MPTKPGKRFDPGLLVRPSIAKLKPYSSARDEFTGHGRVFLDANENSLGSPTDTDYSRYPDPYQRNIKRRLAEIESVAEEQIFIGNGSDEAIDLLFRVFCEPRTDNCVICPPTYGMYEVSAGINEVEVRRARLDNNFSLDPTAIAGEADEHTKLVFICSPNNPTGNSMDRGSVLEIADSMSALVVVDEAYIHFSGEISFIREIGERPNIVVLRTFSKAWGLAGLRVGAAIADASVIRLLNRVKPPYNVSEAAQREIAEALNRKDEVDSMIADILRLKDVLRSGLGKLEPVREIFASDANFLLVRVDDPKSLYRYLIDEGIVVRDRSRVELCEGCLRITVGTEAENNGLLGAIKKFEKENR